MAQMIVRQIPDETLARFKDRARREGMSAEAFMRSLIEREASRQSRLEALKRMDELRAMTPKSLTSSVDILRAIRDGNDDSR